MTDLDLLRAAGFLGYTGLATIYGELTAELPFNHCDTQIFGTVSAGAFTYFNYGGEVTDATIGRYCSIGQRAIIHPGRHPTDMLSTHPFVSPNGAEATGMGGIEALRAILSDVALTGKAGATHVSIGHDVWIGARSIILPGVTIGSGAIIGAAAVVTRDVAPYSVVVGSPARHLRYRLSPTLAKQILASEWWDWDLRGVPGRRDYRDPAAFLRKFLDARDSDRLRKLAPPVITVVGQVLSAASAAWLSAQQSGASATEAEPLAAACPAVNRSDAPATPTSRLP